MPFKSGNLSISLCFHKNAYVFFHSLFYVFLKVHKLDASPVPEIQNAPCCLQCEGLVYVTTLEFFLISHRLETDTVVTPNPIWSLSQDVHNQDNSSLHS